MLPWGFRGRWSLPCRTRICESLRMTEVLFLRMVVGRTLNGLEDFDKNMIYNHDDEQILNY